MAEAAYRLCLLIHSAVSDLVRMVACRQIGLHYTQVKLLTTSHLSVLVCV